MKFNIFKYDSLTSLRAAIDKTPIMPAWQGKDIISRQYDKISEAVDMLTTGDVKSAKKILNACKVNKPAQTARRIQFESSVVGCLPNVPAYINGLPKQMYNVTRKPNKMPILNMYVHMSICCGVSKEQIAEAGAKICGVIKAVEKSGIRVNLYAVDTGVSGGECHTICVRIKKAESPLNLFNIAYCFINELYERRVCFMHMERFYEKYLSGYGYVCKEPELREQFNGVFIETEKIINYGKTTEQLTEYVNEYIKTL